MKVFFTLCMVLFFFWQTNTHAFFYKTSNSLIKIWEHFSFEKKNNFLYLIGEKRENIISLLNELSEEKYSLLEEKVEKKIQGIHQEMMLLQFKFETQLKKQQEKKLGMQLVIYNEFLQIIQQQREVKTIEIFENIAYDLGEQNTMDIYSTPVKNAPLVIYVHWGGWKWGDKEADQQKWKYFAKNGINFATLNYTLYPEADYTQQVWEIVQAFKFLSKNAYRIGADNSKMYLLWHSSGGHLITLLATDESYLTKVGHSFEDISAVISLDTGGYDILEIQQNTPTQFDEVYKEVFWEDKEDLKEASPIYKINQAETLPNFYMFTSTLWDETRFEIQNNFYQKLVESWNTAEFFPYEFDHDDFHQQIWWEWFEEYSQTILSIFQ